MNDTDLPRVLANLRQLPHETEWVEFKVNNTNPNDVGQYISAIANSAALHEKNEGYIVWGVENRTHNFVGTTFSPRNDKQGNQPLELWLTLKLSPRIHFTIHEGTFEGRNVVIFCIPAASSAPVAFDGVEYIRVGEAKTLLRNHNDKEKSLWSRFEKLPCELRPAMDRLSEDEVLPLLDFSKYFELHKKPLPENRTGILEVFEADRLIRSDPEGFVITNLGAILFAKSLRKFERLGRKAVRAVVYSGNDRVNISRQQEGDRGYAAGFEGLVAWLNTQLPQNEPIGQALRTTAPMYPEVAIREIVANALIHQDLTITGSGPLIEIFPNRIEITNPGRPLVDPARFLDLPPRSRNEHVADTMRRVGMCEELGSGIDRVLRAIEMFQLPAPQFVETLDSTRVTLFSYRSFANMNREERIRACYQHASLKYVMDERMTNSTLRERFGIKDENYAQVSRVIADAVKAKMIKPDPPGATRHAKYVPFWASTD